MTAVANVYHLPKDWALDSRYVYIGRAGKGLNGTWGNPIIVGAVCARCGCMHSDNMSVLPCYRQYLFHRLNTEPTFAIALRALQGKTLECFCKPKPCHGDVMCKAIEWLVSKS